ncbi:MAG: ABC transporter permease subunit [Clostridiales bacterium]|jgi:multiple sugar transport system permease protein/putative aldouronate transport system permease protein|nr:ABC transporter permease subunit [Clostridiales bacterium]
MKALLRNTYKNRALALMALPGVVLAVLFSYVPMAGLVTAFKRFDYSAGIWGSPWVWFDNFKFLFSSHDLTFRMLRNTVGYYLLFTAVTTVLNVALAIALNEARGKRFAKIAQSLMILPRFISWVAVTFIVTALLDPKKGMFNHLLEQFGKNPVSWYTEPGYWPAILTIVVVWSSVGYGSVLYLSALAGMDEVFESAALDGASKWQQIWYITLPMLASLVCVLTLMGLGGIMTSNTGLFFQVTKNVGALYPATQTIDAYVLNALSSSNTSFGMTAAVTFFQSFVGFAMVFSVNMIVRRIEPEFALF